MDKAFARLAIMFCILLASCSRTLEREEYVRWVEDYTNGLHIQKAAAGFVFDLQYLPAAYRSLLNSPSGTPTSAEQGMQYYTLKIDLKDSPGDIISYHVRDISEKQQRLYYFSYLFQNDLYLEEAGEKIPCVLFHFEQSDLQTSRTFVLGFETSGETLEESSLVIDSQQFDSLPIKIKVSKQNIPVLKL